MKRPRQRQRRRLDARREQREHLVARLNYPWRLANGQILVETGGAEDGEEPDAEDERGDGAEPAARRGPSIRSL